MLGRLFGHSSFLGEDLEPWCLETWAWLMRNLGGMERLRSIRLATPSRELITPTDATGHDRALHIFEHVKLAMGMGSWTAVLEPFDSAHTSAQVGEFWILRPVRAAPAGTFHWGEDGAVVRYASELVERPAALVAVMAHELCHYLLATIAEPAPGGAETHELDTDLAVAYAGFGVVAANAAFFYHQHRDAFSEGWRSQRMGYLSEHSWAFALALFLRLKGEVGGADAWLKPGIKTQVAKADRYLAKHDHLLAPLRAIP